MKWQFAPQSPMYVQTEVTQRDQFKNDDVNLSDTIVREAIQNSLDAGNGHDPVRVRVRWVSGEHGLTREFMQQLLDEQIAHATSAGLDMHGVDFEHPVALVIEDFGTSGLTGSTTIPDDGNFSDFWRGHGRSHKTGKSRGRWGLGKLVFSSCSGVRAFFGLTVRADGPQRYLMGQSVLGLHTHDGANYPAHSFFSEVVGDSLVNQTPVPVVDDDLLRLFVTQFDLRRVSEPGLSVMIPFPLPELDPSSMIGIAIENYFYPIITGQLVVEVDGIEIVASNIRELAKVHAKKKIADIDLLFDFIEEANATPDEDLLVLNPSWSHDNKLDADDFQSDDLEKLKDRFRDGEMVAVRLPLTITKKTGEKLETGFSVFIRRPEEVSMGHDLYVRGGLTLPAEQKFRERKAMGVMIAEEEPIADFLGDAENAAHTKWDSQAEKLTQKWKNPANKLRVIRNALVNLYDLLAHVEEEEDEAALRSYFWMDLPDNPTKNKKRKKVPVVVPPIPEPKPRPVRVESIAEGFAVRPGTGADTVTYPLRIRVAAAYNIASGNAFKKFDPLDFDFTKKGGPKIAITKNGTVVEREPNALLMEFADANFGVNVTGFDANRDLQVKVRSLED